MRLFKGPIAGYRIDQNLDGSWSVKVVEQGQGNRYTITTAPYSLTFVSPGEFTRVKEGYVFSNDSVLLLYESGRDETVIRSAFVPF